MGLIDWFRSSKRNEIQNGEIDEERFIENTPPLNGIGEQAVLEKAEAPSEGIELIFSYLAQDFEERGYNDAMTNPDTTYKEDNIKLLRYDLALRIDQVDSYYSDMKNTLDFHIKTRSRSGLIDMVEALQTKLFLLNEHIEKLNKFKTESESQTGVSERVVLSYKRGFSRGLAALSHAQILNKPL